MAAVNSVASSAVVAVAAFASISAILLATRGLNEDDVRHVARLMDKVIMNIKSNEYNPKIGIDDSIIDDKVIEEVHNEVVAICKKYPLINR